MPDDILAAIDAAVGCQQCGGPLGDSPSTDFCSERCDLSWRARHVEPLVGYWEPWHRPWDFPGIGTEQHRSNRSAQPATPAPPFLSSDAQALGEHLVQGLAEGLRARPPVVTGPMAMIHVEWPGLQFRLPRSTSDLLADWQVARIAQATASTDAQRAAVALRIESLTERSRAEMTARAEAFRGVMDEISVRFRGTMDTIGTLFGQIRESLRPLGAALRDVGLVDEPELPADPRERALQARRNRNTGPPVQRRPPRRIDPRGVYR